MQNFFLINKISKSRVNNIAVAQNTLDKRLDNNLFLLFLCTPKFASQISHDAHYAAIVGLENVEKQVKGNGLNKTRINLELYPYPTYHPKGEFYLM